VIAGGYTFFGVHAHGLRVESNAASQGLEAWPGIRVRVFMRVQQAQAGGATWCGPSMHCVH
jgi:hypothetical protein